MSERTLVLIKPDGVRRVIAARVRGVLHSAFAAAPEPPKPDPAHPDASKRPDNFPAYRAQSDGPANMVVVGDSDILADRFWVRVQDFFGSQDATPFSAGS